MEHDLSTQFLMPFSISLLKSTSEQSQLAHSIKNFKIISQILLRYYLVGIFIFQNIMVCDIVIPNTLILIYIIGCVL